MRSAAWTFLLLSLATPSHDEDGDDEDEDDDDVVEDDDDEVDDQHLTFPSHAYKLDDDKDKKKTTKRARRV